MATTDGKTSKRDEYCCVPLCNGNARVHTDLSFHHIPTEKKKDARKAWLVAIRRDEGPFFKITNNTVVCSRHFKAEDFRWTPNRKTLKSGAIPSVFPWKAELNVRKPPTERTPLKNVYSASDNIPPADLKNVEPAASSDGHANKVVNENDDPLLVLSHDIHTDCKSEIAILKRKVEEQANAIAQLSRQVEIERFGLRRFAYDDHMIEFYTGFPSYECFITFYEWIKPSASRMKSVYYVPNEDLSVCGRPKSMDLIDEFFMFLCRLKCGFPTEDLAVRFNIHRSTVSRKIISWANYLYFILGSINIWASRRQILQNMPTDFQLLYPHTRIIIDCTEIFTERPSSLALASKTYSSYKSHNTWKGLVGIAPNGAVTFISSLYSGCMSDVEITKLSGLIDLLQQGDEIMADKGFVLDKLLAGTNITVSTPHFLCCDGQFAPSQIEDNQKIASLRIHVERHIKRVKEYKLFQSVVPLSLAGSINQLWTVANLLTLFKKPLIQQK